MSVKENPGSNYYSLILDSQLSWKKLSRGKLSRPVEMRPLSGLIDNEMKKVFAGYINSDHPPLTIAASVLDDSPGEPYKYYMEHVYPSTIQESDRINFRLGVGMMDEWLTVFITKVFFRKVSLLWPIDQLSRVIGELDSQQKIYPTVYELMGKVEKAAKKYGLNMEDAILKAYFIHEQHDLNEIIKNTGLEDCNGINDLAITVGRKAYEANDPKIEQSRSLQKQDDDSKIELLVKRIKSSLYICGHSYRQPGVVDLVFARDFIELASLTSITELIALPTRDLHVMGLGFILGMGVGTVDSLMSLPNTLIHESIHGYSTSQNYVGIIPWKISINKSSK